jgi:hypothetical protein
MQREKKEKEEVIKKKVDQEARDMAVELECMREEEDVKARIEVEVKKKS